MTKSKAVVLSYVGVVVLAAPIFVAAGKLVYRQGLLYLCLALGGTTLSHLLVRADSSITTERAARVREGEAWDKRLLAAMFLTSTLMFTTAGLDSGRFGWSRQVPLGVALAGAVLMVAGQILFALAKRENAFFTSTVRIEAGGVHRVCDTGLYRVVRHPGYLGMLLSQLAFPLVLESFWAFVLAALGALLLVLRTVLEDRFLLQRLDGYAAYAARTRWRLVPGLF